MKQYFCNPLNFSYRYQFNETTGGLPVQGEAAGGLVELVAVREVEGKY